MSVLKTLTISDIHLHHRSTTNDNTIKGLTAILTDSVLSELDIIWLAGDIYDRLLDLPDVSVTEIQLWILSLLRICKTRNIRLRILEGTPSHDRGQSIEFIRLNDTAQIQADVQYIDKLYIEHLKDHDLTVLYIPDEYHSSNDETYVEVCELMTHHRLERVDYIVMHGMFEYQVPNGLSLPSHDSKKYMDLVNRYIFIGHVHQMSQLDKILAQGSFNRLVHGDEETKGCWLVTVDADDRSNDKLVFLENTNATIYKTIDTVGLDPVSLDLVLSEIKDLPLNSHCRIKHIRNFIHLSIIKSHCHNRPDIFWTMKVVKELSSDVINNDILTYAETPLNANSIPDIVRNRLEASGHAAGVIHDTLINLKDIIYRST